MTAPRHVIVAWEGVSGFALTGAAAAYTACGYAPLIVAAEAVLRTSEGLRFVPHALGFDGIATAEHVVLPDGEPARAANDPDLTRALRGHRGRVTLAAGGGLDVLQRAGLLAGRRVACAPGEVARHDTTASAARLVRDERLYSCALGDCLIDLVWHVLALEIGDDAVAAAAQRLGRDYQPFAFGAE